MANTITELLTASNSITCTAAGLANGASRQSTAISNATTEAFDVGVIAIISTGAGPSTTGTVSIYAYGSPNAGTNYTDGVTGTDGAFTPNNPTNLKLIGLVSANSGNNKPYGGPFSVASAFGYLPGSWGIVVTNNSGASLAAATFSYETNQGTYT